MEYRLLIDIEALDILDRLPKKVRTRLLQHFVSIRSFPGSHSDYHESDATIGGIQTFCRLFVRALRDIYPEAQISVFSKNDTSFPDPDNDPADHFAPVGWWSLPLRTPVFAAELFWRGIWERPDFVAITHVNFTPVAEALQKVCHIPYLAVGHGIEVWDLPGRRIRSALRKADLLLAVSEFTRQKMAAALGLPSHRIQVLPNTFEAEQFEPAVKPHFLLKRYHLRPDQPVILTIARLASAERYKGYDQILRVLPKIRETMPDVHYILGGRGPDKARIESLIAELGLEDSVTLAGYVPDHELSAHYNLCDVFAMPSKGEGFGIVFLEAMACGRVVIAGNKDGSADALQNGALGVLIDPDDLQELSDTIVSVLAEVERRKAEGGGTAQRTGNREQRREIRGQHFIRWLPAPSSQLPASSFKFRRSSFSRKS